MTTDDPETGLPPGVTPGPWEVGCHPVVPGFIVRPVMFGARGHSLPACEGGHYIMRNEADARLIAAAPDLYRALVRLRVWVVDEVGAELPCESIDAALAAARKEGDSHVDS